MLAVPGIPAQPEDANLHWGRGLHSAEELEDVVMFIHKGELGPCPKVTLVFFEGSSRVSASPRFPD